MSQQGWVKVHRKIKDCWIWNINEPFDKRSAWIDLVINANHADNKTLINNQLIEIKRGSFITSEIKLSEHWKWDRGKVRRFLKLLEEDNMIKKTPYKRLYITVEIINYDTYQAKENATTESIDIKEFEDIGTTSNEQETNNEQTSNKQVTNINKNDKNDKNVKKKTYSDNSELNQTLLDFIKMRKTIKKPITDEGITLILNKLKKLSADENIQIEILNQSILNSWQGVFPLKDNKEGDKSGSIKPKEIHQPRPSEETLRLERIIEERGYKIEDIKCDF